jgi:hypothetical protein
VLHAHAFTRYATSYSATCHRHYQHTAASAHVTRHICYRNKYYRIFTRINATRSTLLRLSLRYRISCTFTRYTYRTSPHCYTRFNRSTSAPPYTSLLRVQRTLRVSTFATRTSHCRYYAHSRHRANAHAAFTTPPPQRTRHRHFTTTTAPPTPTMGIIKTSKTLSTLLPQFYDAGHRYYH